MSARLIALGATAVIACSGSTGAPAPDAAPDIDADETVDLSEASWELEPIEGSADSGFSPKMSFTGNGEAVAVWQLNDASAVGFGVRRDGRWEVRFIDPPAGASGVFSPDVAGGAGDQAHIVFSASNPDTGGDIIYVRWDGTAPSVLSNLTSGGQSASDTDSSPAVAVSSTGEVTVFYTFTPDPMSFTRELRVLSFTNAGAPSPFETLFDSARNCGQIRALVVDDVVHAAVLCQGGTDEVVYLNNRSGSFQPQSAGFATDGLAAPDLAIGTDGSVHLVAQTNQPCGDTTCTVPTYSKNLAPAIPATVDTESYFNPSVALDSENQPVIVFFELPDRDLFWTFGTDAGFFRRQPVTTAGGGKLVGTGATDPATGLPWFVIEDRDRSPQIWMARLVP